MDSPILTWSAPAPPDAVALAPGDGAAVRAGARLVGRAGLAAGRQPGRRPRRRTSPSPRPSWWPRTSRRAPSRPRPTRCGGARAGARLAWPPFFVGARRPLARGPLRRQPRRAGRPRAPVLAPWLAPLAGPQLVRGSFARRRARSVGRLRRARPAHARAHRRHRVAAGRGHGPPPARRARGHRDRLVRHACRGVVVGGPRARHEPAAMTRPPRPAAPGGLAAAGGRAGRARRAAPRRPRARVADARARRAARPAARGRGRLEHRHLAGGGEPRVPALPRDARAARRRRGGVPGAVRRAGHPRVGALVVDTPRRPGARALAALAAGPVWWDARDDWRRRWGHRVYGEVLCFDRHGRYLDTRPPG